MAFEGLTEKLSSAAGLEGHPDPAVREAAAKILAAADSIEE